MSGITTPFAEFISGLSELEIAEYADRVGSSVGYIQVHLKHARKTPRKELIEKLWQESQGKLTREDVLNHFFPPPEAAGDVRQAAG